ncbi:PglL family O-oligosaccharyltransferase [Acinetobacter sp.]|uniref:PglL family O-oligosaccharyltransferase n=1 Tax=Acinetobacter sp. TaxID=472 RepID=UPI002647B742|nr:O-antigen ligase family protein [Acinetobacter sp.]MDN5513146.1 Wzy polymerase domain-containing protein [Acinetobacter sp.]MDN5526132.1 Wzy polymerase domain-containing protein [Acinetobacter sp.]
MKFLLLLLASVFISLAWLLPIHYRPWVTYTGELFAFLSLFVLAAIYLKDKIKLPIISFPLLLLAVIPLVQYGAGELFFFDKALICTLFVLGFWLSMVVGYNLSSEKADRESIFTGLSYVFLMAGTATGVIAICQWTNLDAHLPGMINIQGNTRPYANFAQPNNMATFLMMSLMACLYLYEKKKVQTKWLVVCALPMLIGVALSQSRTSWVACLCILAYLAYQQYRGFIRLKWYWTISWLGVFVGLIVVAPILSQLLAQATDAHIIQSRDVVQRATGDMSRLAIWQQMLHAIADRPWLGYGWNQTSVAYTLVSDHFQGPVWIRSAHNFILDFILWNGVIIGLPFLAYFGYWGYQLNKRVNSVESVIGILMVGAVLIHSMLEFPQYYAYFLLPVGFIIGLIQSQQADTKVLTLSPNYMRVTYGLSILLLILIVRDYSVMVPKLNQTLRYEKTPQKITNQDQIYLLEEFNRRIDWIRMNPYSKVSAQQLDEIREMVLNYPTAYDLLKYAKILAFNGYEQEARHQLRLLKKLRKVDLDYASLAQPVAKK